MSSDDLPTSNKSIATSVLIQPSFLLQILIVIMAVSCSLVALCVLLGLVGPENDATRYGSPAVGLAASVRLLVELIRQRRSYVLHITGSGEIRMQAATANGADISLTRIPASADLLSLAAGSVITPMILVLRLADTHGNIKTILIFTDSVTPDAFRRLSLACRWLAGQQKRRQSAST